MADLFCEHLRLEDQCEECSWRRALERGRPVPDPSPPAPQRKVADTDLLIKLEGDTDSAVLVRAGDAIPVGLEDRPTTSASVYGYGQAKVKAKK